MCCLTINMCCLCVKLNVAMVLIFPVDFYWAYYSWVDCVNSIEDPKGDLLQMAVMGVKCFNSVLRTVVGILLVVGYIKNSPYLMNFWVWGKAYLIIWLSGKLIYYMIFYSPPGRRGYFWSKVNPNEPLIGLFLMEYILPLAAYAHFLMVVNSYRRLMKQEIGRRRRTIGGLGVLESMMLQQQT